MIIRKKNNIDRKRDTMDINEIKKVLESNKKEILELWRSL